MYVSASLAQSMGHKKVESIAFIFGGNGSCINISGKDDRVSFMLNRSRIMPFYVVYAHTKVIVANYKSKYCVSTGLIKDS